MLKKVFIVILSLFPLIVSAEVVKHGTWLGTFTKKSMTENLDLWAETQMRYNWDKAGMAQTLHRFGVLQNLSEVQALGYLYGFIQSDANKEHRLTVQHVYKYSFFETLKFSHRLRVEFRDIENSSDDSMRTRLLLKFSDKLTEIWNWTFYNEFFVNLSEDEWTGDQSFERNRSYIGVSKKYEEFVLHIGYVNQFVPREMQDTMEHNLYFGFNF